jgi:hypothetical protein
LPELDVPVIDHADDPEALESVVESEKPKKLVLLGPDESSTDPLYSDGSTLGYGSSEILSGGLNQLDPRLARNLNDLDSGCQDPDPEPRTLIFNIPSDCESDAPSNAVIVMTVDTSTSVI